MDLSVDSSEISQLDPGVPPKKIWRNYEENTLAPKLYPKCIQSYLDP